MKAIFIELPSLERLRAEYFDDEAFRGLQQELMKSPKAGDVIKGTGGLRKIRYADERRGKGKRAACGSSTSGKMPIINSGCSRCTTRTRRPTSPPTSAGC